MKEPKVMRDLKPGDRVEAVVKLVVTDAKPGQYHVLVRPTEYVEQLRVKEGAKDSSELEPMPGVSSWRDGEPFFISGNAEVIRALVLNGVYVG